jgi:hypothetical protein
MARVRSRGPVANRRVIFIPMNQGRVLRFPTKVNFSEISQANDVVRRLPIRFVFALLYLLFHWNCANIQQQWLTREVLGGHLSRLRTDLWSLPPRSARRRGRHGRDLSRTR